MRRKVDLSNIPTKKRGQKFVTNWKESTGCKIPFEYDGIIGELKIVKVYLGKHIKLDVKYNDNITKTSSDTIRQAKLSKVLKIKSSDFIFNVGDKFKRKNGYMVITDRFKQDIHKSDGYVESRKKYKYKCTKCGYRDGVIDENDLKRGKGCACCAGKVVSVGINDILTTAPELQVYFSNCPNDIYKYTASSNKKINPTCPVCGQVSKKKYSINTLNRVGFKCSICSSGVSYPERFISSLLNEAKIEYIYQYTKCDASWIENEVRYDFYLPKYDVIIETHGYQHYKEKCFTNKFSLQEQIIKDEEKYIMAKEKVSNYIVLDCRFSTPEWILDSIENSLLSKIVSLNDIDITKVIEKSNENKVLLACEYWNSGITSISTIAEKMKVTRTTVKNYLKKGALANLTTYSTTHRQIKLALYKDGVFVEKFDSIKDCIEYTKKNYGIELSDSKVSSVLKGKQSHHKGFQFKKIE